MKKILVGLFAMAAFTFSANAQVAREHKTGMTQHHHQKGMMTKKLNLTADQKTQLKTNRMETKERLQALEKNENMTVKEYKAQKAAILNEQKDKFQRILTPEQKSELANMKAESKTKMGNHQTARLNQMKTKLNLTDDQMAKLKASRETRMAQAKTIKENEKLTASEKMDQMKALREDSKAAYKNILTPEQLQQMEEMKKDHKGKRR
ncbi:hypothetical protein BH11BAC3_BH11BAC3_40990 [soil metagenome]